MGSCGLILILGNLILEGGFHHGKEQITHPWPFQANNEGGTAIVSIYHAALRLRNGADQPSPGNQRNAESGFRRCARRPDGPVHGHRASFNEHDRELGPFRRRMQRRDLRYDQ